jgi:uncharacterized protein (TIGR00369 family)
MIGAARAATMPGIDYLQAMIDGEIPPPPIVSLMNMDLVSVGPGTATFTCHPDESHYNPIGSVHGGFVCTVLDSAAGCAVQTTLPAGTGYTSLEIKVSYLRGVSATTGPLTVVGTVTKPGSRVAFAEAVARCWCSRSRPRDGYDWPLGPCSDDQRPGRSTQPPTTSTTAAMSAIVPAVKRVRSKSMASCGGTVPTSELASTTR